MWLLVDAVCETEEFTMGIIDTLWPIVFVILATVLLFIYKEQIRDSKWSTYLPIVMLTMMIVFEWNYFGNILRMPFQPLSDTAQNLPLHLCGSSAVLVMLYLGFRKEIFFELLVVQGIAGAIVTFVFPTVTAQPLSYEYMRFFLSHALLLIVPMYLIIIEKKKINRKTLVKAFIFVHILAAVAVGVNLLADTHYMYLLPDNSQNLLDFLPLLDIMPFLGNWPMVILLGEALVFPVYFLVYFGVKKLQNQII